jgi:hypothetical protein
MNDTSYGKGDFDDVIKSKVLRREYYLILFELVINIIIRVLT